MIRENAMRWMAMVWMIMPVAFVARAGEERIRGMLEKTDKAEACAQIKDALNELYYVTKSDAAEKMVANFVGKSQRVVLTGTVENKSNESVPYINLKTVEPYAPKLPPAPPPPAPPPLPPAAEKKEEPKKPDEPKAGEKKPEEKKSDEKQPEVKKTDEKKLNEKKLEEKK